MPTPKVVEANSYIVPANKIKPPQVIPAQGTTKIPARKPTITYRQSTTKFALTPQVVQLRKASVRTPGQGAYIFPKTVPVAVSSFVGDLPQVVEVKAPSVVEFGATSFKKFSASDGFRGIKGTNIMTLYQDRTGNIWIGYWAAGLDKYDGKTVTHFSTTQGLIRDDVNSILQDRNGNLWFGSWHGLTKYDGKSFTHFTVASGLVGDFIQDLFEDKAGNIWIATAEGVSKYDGKSRSSTFTNYSDAQGLDKPVRKLVQDKIGNLWFWTDQGLMKYDGTSFTSYVVDGTDWEGFKASIDNGTFDGNSYTKYSSSLNPHANYAGEISGIGLASEIGVPPAYVDAGKSTIALLLSDGKLQGYVAPLVDRNANLWITSGGVLKSNGRVFTHLRAKEGLTNGVIRSLIAGRNGSIWVGVWGNGVNQIDNTSIRQYTVDQGLTSNLINAIHEDSKENIWFGNWEGGLDKFDGKTITNYPSILNITCIIEDKKGNLWIGTEDGVYKYDGTTFTHLTTNNGLSGNRVFSVLEDRDGNLWFGTIGNGVTKYDPDGNDGGAFTHYAIGNGLNDVTIHSMLQDRQGNIWFGTGNGGVNKFDGKEFIHYTIENGLPSNEVNSMLEDNDGNLWFGTSNGLSKMRPSTLESKPKMIGKENKVTSQLFKNYSFSDGFLGVGTWYNSLIQDKNGTIWAGTTDGISAYHPEEDFPDTIPPVIQLSGVSLFNENINWLQVEKSRDTVVVLQNGAIIENFKFSTVSNWNYTPEDLELAYNNNAITFKFTGVTTNKPERVQYQYKLDGLENNWSAVTPSAEATYTNLSHGAYVFKAKAMNSEGYWSDELNYSFIIHPPWWFSWWAYAIYALFFIGLLRIVHVFQKRRVVRVERAKSQLKELEQAKEIEKAYTNLKATQAQLIQSEKMASLGELTAGIAHEIQNPLNFVNNFSEINKELIGELKQEIKKGNLGQADSIASDIEGNEEKINHHGKRADSIVKGMLQHSRASSGQKVLTEINALCDEYLRLAYHGLRAKNKNFNAKVETDFASSLPKINVVPQDIGRVVLNLINNAFYAVSEKSKQQQNDYEPTVSVSTNQSGDKVLILVKDNGNGIPDSIKEKIFQPFFTTKPTGQGTGLGLSLSYDIVKVHGGELRVESEEQDGSEFIIILPAP
jgi:signal transduction histidine kinase/ligand-binding sensor domain-containing protein